MEAVQVSNLRSSSKIKVNTMNSSVKTKPVQCLGLFFIYSKKQMQDLSGHKKGEQKPAQLQRYFLVLKDSRIQIPTYVTRHKIHHTSLTFFVLLFLTVVRLNCCFYYLPLKKNPKGKNFEAFNQ